VAGGRGGALRTWLAAVFAVSIGCGAPALPEALEGSREVRVSSDPLDGRRLLAADSARAVAAGAGGMHLVGVDMVVDGDRVGGFVDVPETECLLVHARGSEGVHDVDLYAYADDGSAVSSDESPEVSAALIVCPPHPRRLYIVGRAVSGMGLLAVGAHGVSTDAADAAANALSARGRPGEGSGRLASWPGLEVKVARHRAALGSRWQDLRRLAMPVDARSPTALTVSVEAGRCLDVLVTPADELGMLEVAVFDEGGRVLGRAKNVGRDRTLLLCSEDDLQATVMIRPHAARGLVAVVTARSDVGAEAELLDAALVGRLSQSLSLPEARAELRRDLGKRSYSAAKTVGAGKARVGSRSAFSLALAKGCSRVDVIGGKPLVDITAALWGADGRLVGESRGSHMASLFYCGAGGGVRVDVEALGRPGPFAIEVRRDRAAPPPLTDQGLAASRLLERLDEPGQRADASMANDARVVALRPEQLERRALRLDAHQCATVIVAADAGGSGVELRLVDDRTGEDSLSRAAYVVADRVCASDSPRKMHTEVRLRHGAADVLVLVRLD